MRCPTPTCGARRWRRGGDPGKVALALVMCATVILCSGMVPLSRAQSQSLIHAIMEGDHAEISLQLDLNPDAVNEVDEDGWTPLMFAAYRGEDALASDLIAAGADVSHMDKDGMTPIIWAAQQHDSTSMLEILHAAGASLSSASTDEQVTCLLAAIQTGHSAAAKWLVERGADVNAQSRTGVTPLIAAAAQGDALLCDTLLKRGARANKRTKSARVTALMTAAQQGYSDCVRVLAPSSKLDLKNRRGVTALMLAAAKGHVEVVESLLSFGADPKSAVRVELDEGEHEDGIAFMTALSIAQTEGHEEVARLLQEHEAMDL